MGEEGEEEGEIEVVDCCAVSSPLLHVAGVSATAAVVVVFSGHSLATLSRVSMVDLRHTRPVWAGSAVRIAYSSNRRNANYIMSCILIR